MTEENTPQDTGSTTSGDTQPAKPTTQPIIEPNFDVVTEGSEPPKERREKKD